MKLLKITVLILLALNILVPLFQSCTKDTSKTDNPEGQTTLDNLVKIYNEGVILEHEKALLLEGEMIIMTLPSQEVLFFLKKGGESSFNVFLGQGTELSTMIRKELGKVKVAYLREAIAVETEDGDIYSFTIGERKGHKLVQKLTPVWSGKGYGLAYNYSRPEKPSDYIGLFSTDDLVRDRATPSTCRCENTSTVDPNTCNSGGAGATSCSIGATVNNGTTVDPGCSVSCSEHQFACCMNYVQ